jgi:hypothetical protein
MSGESSHSRGVLSRIRHGKVASTVASLQAQPAEATQLGEALAPDLAAAMRRPGARPFEVARSRASKITRYEMANVEYMGPEGAFIKPMLVGFGEEMPVVFEPPDEGTTLIEVSDAFKQVVESATARAYMGYPHRVTDHQIAAGRNYYTRRQATGADFAALAAQVVSGGIRKGFAQAGMVYAGTAIEKWEQMAVAIAKTNPATAEPGRVIG